MATAFLSLAFAMVSMLPQQPQPVPSTGPQVGQPAPAFRLNDHEGRAVALGGPAKTWTVLAFFPKAATPG